MLVDCFDRHEPWDPPRKYVELYGDPDYSGRERPQSCMRTSQNPQNAKFAEFLFHVLQ